MDNATHRLEAIRGRIEAARRRFGPPPERVELVAVSKTFDAEAIRPFLDAGQRVFGENRVQEAKEKWPALRASYDGIELHLIGPLQTNKAREAVALFDVIQSVDRDKLARVLAEEMQRAGRRLPVFVQVNIGLEPQKAGIAPAEAVAFVERCRSEHGLEVRGLMCIPPDGRAARAVFRASGDAGPRRQGRVPVDGDERRLRDRHRHGRDACAGRQRAVRGAGVGGPSLAEARHYGAIASRRCAGFHALATTTAVIPAKAGIHGSARSGGAMDPCLRRDDTGVGGRTATPHLDAPAAARGEPSPVKSRFLNRAYVTPI